MSRIAELIEAQIGSGTKFVPLWSITTWDKRFNAVDRAKQPRVSKYKYLLANELAPLVVAGGDVKLLTTNSSNLWTTEELAGDAMREAEIVAIPWGGNPIVQYFKGKFVTSDNRIAVANDPTELNMKYLHYFLSANLGVIASFYRGSGIKHPSMAQVLDLSVPLPDIELQAEIAHTLDHFEELEKSLTAELAARRKQYEYYRDKLLTFEEAPA